MAISANPMTVVKNFSQLRSDLSRLDGQLTEWSNNGHIYPRHGTNDRFDTLADTLDQSRTDLAQLHPEKEDLLGSLKKDVLRVARAGGTVFSMEQHQNTFSSGWPSTLDNSIADCEKALDAAADTTAGTPKPAPNPMQVVRNTSKLQSDFSHQDAQFEAWASNGHIYPNSSVYENLDQLASRLFDVRDSLATLHPEQTDLIRSLSKDVLHASFSAGNLNAMADHNYTFANGWGSTLDKTISDLGRAVEVLTGA